MKNNEGREAIGCATGIWNFAVTMNGQKQDAVNTLNQYGVLEYLEKSYEPLHTQGKQWLLEEIDEFINIRKGASR